MKNTSLYRLIFQEFREFENQIFSSFTFISIEEKSNQHFKNQDDREEKKRDARFYISHEKERDFFQFPFSHEKKNEFLSMKIRQNRQFVESGKRFSSIFLSPCGK